MLVLGVLIKPHIKYELIWRFIVVVNKVGIKTYCNRSSLYQKGILGQINLENSQILYIVFEGYNSTSNQIEGHSEFVCYRN
jgi:hypothetical protein